jgi:phenylpropionate dioxygenase-like ring-hydroxylating dioxygenase large terminal subunit
VADVQEGMRRALAYHWHPVCTADELPGPVGVRLLGRDLAVAQLGSGRVVAFDDRCPHRSTRLSVGEVDGDCLRCAYHGWAFGADGRCRDIPSLPDGPIPGRAAVTAYDAAVRHGLVWVRLDRAADTEIPPCPGLSDPAMKVLACEPYTWPVSALRRVENFVDLAHFAFVHDGSLGRRDQPVPPLPEVVARVDGALRFDYDMPPLDSAADEAMVAASAYQVVMPCTVDIEFRYLDRCRSERGVSGPGLDPFRPGSTGRRRRLWLNPSPVDDGICRTFWCIGRTDDLAGDDRAHLAFQQQVTAEDEPVVTNQVPAELPLDPGEELSVRTDKVSIEYRRWLRDLATAALAGPDAYRAALRPDEPAPQLRAGGT